MDNTLSSPHSEIANPQSEMSINPKSPIRNPKSI